MYLFEGPIKIARSFVIDPFSTQSIQILSNVLENAIVDKQELIPITT